MQQHELRQPNGAILPRKRIGRGNASGHGTYSTKGLKGQKARSGGGVRQGFEGGQLPLIRRMAYKRGFRNPFRVDYEEVNVGTLARFDAGTELNRDALVSARIVRPGRPGKVLGSGDLSVPLTVEGDSFSKSARATFESAGGTARWLHGEPEAAPAEAAVEPPAAAPTARPRRSPKTKDLETSGAAESPQQENGHGAGS